MEKAIQESYISIMSNKVKMHGGVNLAQGLPGYEPPAELLKCLHDSIHTSVHQYAPATGNFDLLEHINQKYSDCLNLSNFAPLVTCGATEAISLIYNYLHLKLAPSYSVLAFNPTYESYRSLPQLYNIPFVLFGNLKDEEIDFELLEKTLIINNVKVLFFSSPGNPHGKRYSNDEISKLILLAEKHQFYLIMDDVYSELYFHSSQKPPYDALNEYCFLINSFSKQFSITGWRVGYLFAHKTHFLGVKNLHDYTGLSAPSVLQSALASFLSLPNLSHEYSASLRNWLNRGFVFYQHELEQLGFYIPKTDGGYFVWTRLPMGISDGVRFANFLYDNEKVAVVPGIHFSSDAKDWIRINIARPYDELEKALDSIKISVNGLLSRC